jgi:glycolate oxidase iron-sulfur subunit
VVGVVEAVNSSASGCGVTYKDYARLLQGDPDYAQKAAEVAARVLDVSEYLAEFKLQAASAATRVAWHAPCTLQHGQQLRGGVESLLLRAGYELVDVVDAHLCCGSAGSYSMLQPEMSAVLKQRKLGALQRDAPDVIATANVGCQTHLASGSQVPVVHWIELVK